MNETTPLPYRVVSSEENPLYRHFGSLCIPYENYVLHFMRVHAGEVYQGGVYEFRLYPNGALVMALPDPETKITYQSDGGMCDIEISLECLSYVAAAYFWSAVSNQAFEREDDRTNEFAYDHFHATRDAVSGLFRFVMLEDIGTREPTEEELASANNFIDHPHPESQQFYACID
ncbi:hypothetical protein F3I62_19105 [Pseudomonas sp. R-28-1W-6]|uniref:hypothetical protein n=1 Tax=Pseudomonas sp. R-28-1W-6 TaxID=2650101 RepID=UPI001365DB74|nr:hypothetical protein [Pseudomonas sp. R-28-1W-6]MWV14215.1 hypothetical protein [Pseudomonas sp. R-28-1W-6]